MFYAHYLVISTHPLTLQLHAKVKSSNQMYLEPQISLGALQTAHM